MLFAADISNGTADKICTKYAYKAMKALKMKQIKLRQSRTIGLVRLTYSK
jgi:hypothetical protein